MNSKEIKKSLEKIGSKIIIYNDIHDKIYDNKSFEKYNDLIKTQDYSEEQKNQLDHIKTEISNLLDAFHNESIDEQYFYPDCSFEIYVSYIKKKIKELKTDKEKIELLKGEFGRYKFMDTTRFLFLNDKRFNYHDFIQTSNIDYEKIRLYKINFIEERIRNLGGSPDISRVKKIQQTNFNFDNKYQEEANRVLSNLAKHIGDYDSKMEHYNKEFEYNLNKGLEDDISLDIKIDDLQVDKSYHVTNFLKEFQKLSLKTKYYFFDCPFQVYEDTYHQRKNKYLQDKIDFDESDFIMAELNNSLSFNKVRFLEFENKKYFYHNLINEESYFFKSILKKREYLEHKLYNLGWDAILIEDHDNIPNHYAFEKNANHRNDFLIKTEKEIERENPVKTVVFNESTNTKQQDNNDKKNQLTANQAVILLDKIGFFSHKSIEHLSKNKQASIISKLIGRDKKNIGSYITKLETKKPSEAYSRDISTIDNLLES